MQNSIRQLVEDFLAGVTAGELPEPLLADDMRVWLTTRGSVDKETYRQMIERLAEICATPLTFTIDSITAQDDRVVAEVHSQCTLNDGEDYANTYVFVFRVRNGRIFAIAEHYNALIVEQQILPLLARQREKATSP
jgi:ketosteroid isomerase-like protein